MMKSSEAHVSWSDEFVDAMKEYLEAGVAADIAPVLVGTDGQCAVMAIWCHHEVPILVGLRLTKAELEGSAFFADRTIHEQAFYAVTLGIEEPRSIVDFPDVGVGVRWLPSDEWIPPA